MSGGPVHPGFGKTVLAAVFQSGDRFAQPEGIVPVEVGPIAIRSRGNGLEQVEVEQIVRLFGNMELEGEDFCIRIADLTGRKVDIGGFGGVDFVAREIAIREISVEPEIGRLKVLFVNEGTFDFQVGVMVVGAILPRSGPIPEDFGGVLGGHTGDMAGLAGDRCGVEVKAFIFVQG